jgi:glycosyltransferase involved in cell wall biosynthesis
LSLVSVVIPCFNQAHFLGEAIQSVESQTYREREIIVVDDGSTDATSEVAKRHDVRYIRQDNRGVAVARNRGLGACRGEFLLFLDADDLLAEDAIAAGASCLNRKEDVAFVFGRPDVAGLPPDLLPPRVESDFYLRLLESNYIWMPGLVLHRRRILDQLGGFDPRLGGGADYELYLRITRRFPIAFCSTLRGTYRRHEGSMSRDSARMLRDTSAALRSQRANVRGVPEYRAAYRRGVENLRRAYGRWAAEETIRQLASGRVGAAASSLAILARYDSRDFAGALAGGLLQAAKMPLRKARSLWPG